MLLFEERATMFGKSLARDNRPASEILNEALTVAKDADVIVAALGEAAEMTGEASSRSDIQIPESQRDLLKALVKQASRLCWCCLPAALWQSSGKMTTCLQYSMYGLAVVKLVMPLPMCCLAM